MTYQEALDYMQGLRRFGVKLGNERFEALLERLGRPDRGYSIAHIAGTKGKGSTTALTAAALCRHGFRAGGYYSPYVYDVRERIQVDGQMIPREAFARLVTEIRPHIGDLGASELGQTTEFELKTAVGFCWFAECRVDAAVVEVGLGGRLDATNVVSPTVTVITNIGLDHTHILGDTHAKIAREKAGIIKRGVPCITATDHPDALEVIRCVANERGAPLIRVVPGGPDQSARDGEIHWFTHPPCEAARPCFTVRTVQRDYEGLQAGLAGSYQQVNAACAVGALEVMAQTDSWQIQPDAIHAGFAATSLPGRMQFCRRSPTVLLDGAHNAMAAQALAVEIERLPYRRLLLVLGMVSGHDAEDVVAALAPLAARVYATQPTWQKAIPAEEIGRIARRYASAVCTVTPPLQAARAALADAGEDDLIVVTGSFYVVGDVHPEEL